MTVDCPPDNLLILLSNNKINDYKIFKYIQIFLAPNVKSYEKTRITKL